jgi:hypothetical protein
MTGGGVALLVLATCLLAGPQPCGDDPQRRTVARAVSPDAHLRELMRRHYASAHRAMGREPVSPPCTALAGRPAAGGRFTTIADGEEP